MKLAPLTRQSVKSHTPTYTQVKGKVIAQCSCGENLGKFDGSESGQGAWMDASLAVLAHRHEVRHG